MTPTTDDKDLEYAISLVKLHADCFSGISKKELLRGYLFVDRELEVFLHVIPETRTRTHGVLLPFGGYQLGHIASSKKGSAVRYLKEFSEWAGTTAMWLFVKTDNQRAIDFYKRNGFVIKNIANFKTFSSYIMVRT